MMIILFLIIVLIGIQAFALWGTGFFIQELLISFLPYMLLVNGIILVVLGWMWRKQVQLFGYVRIVLGVVVLAVCILSISIIKNWNGIYHYGSGHPSGQTVSLFYANIYYKNTQVQALLEQIQAYNPDIVLLVEYVKGHDLILAKALQEDYPYASRYIGKKGYDGDMVFSKYPIEKIQHAIHPGSFSHLRIAHPQHTFDLALIHTSAPVSPHFFEMRQNQITLLTTLLSEYYRDNTQQDLILLGDFNISPWSPWYESHLAQPLATLGMRNLTTDLSQTTYNLFMPYTWCHTQLPFVCSHIDHLWARGMQGKIKQVFIDGSDHTGFFAELEV